MSQYPAQNPVEMEPLFPCDSLVELKQLAAELIRQSGSLSSAVHPITRNSIIRLVRAMNSYYSNLIEGHNTHPFDIERALKMDFSSDPKKRALQLESKAHIEVQVELEERLSADPQIDIFSEEFLCWIHRKFYSGLPDEFRKIEHEGNEDWVEPGVLRKCEVKIGGHVAPQHDRLPVFLNRFRSVYSAPDLDPLLKIIAIAASHHRLAWIHPFLDGNGRVTRLFTHASFTVTKTDGHGLWTISRGLARFQTKYRDSLALADQPRYNDLDGRGALSDKALSEFCKFFLNVCLDQIAYMRSILELDSMQDRIHKMGRQLVALYDYPEQVVYVLTDVFLKGEVSRGDVTRILGTSERTARRTISRLLEEGLLVSHSHKAPVKLGFPMRTVGYYFPEMFPQGLELDADNHAAMPILAKTQTAVKRKTARKRLDL